MALRDTSLKAFAQSVETTTSFASASSAMRSAMAMLVPPAATVKPP